MFCIFVLVFLKLGFVLIKIKCLLSFGNFLIVRVDSSSGIGVVLLIVNKTEHSQDPKKLTDTSMVELYILQGNVKMLLKW